MIKQMKRRFLSVSMLSFTVVLFVLLAGLNSLYFWQTIHDLDHDARSILTGQPNTQPRQVEPPSHEVGFSFNQLWGRDDKRGHGPLSYSLVEVDTAGNITQIDVSHSFDMAESDVTTLMQSIITTQHSQGWARYYRFNSTQTENGTKWLLTDASRQLSAITRLLLISGGILLVSLIVIYGLLSFFSKRAIQPLVDNIQRQREFIHNASHEIKTPLAVLTTNNDIIEMMGEETEWTQSNRRQIQRLNTLVEQMLLLARFDEGQQVLNLSPTNIVELLQQVVNELQPLISASPTRVVLPEITSLDAIVDRATFTQLLRILLENAIKYHTGTEPIIFSWQPQTAQLSLTNNCEPMTLAEQQQLFDRFYRRDASRSREKGGSGMGLSIAQSIAEANHVTLSSTLLSATRISFVVQFPTAVLKKSP